MRKNEMAESSEDLAVMRLELGALADLIQASAGNIEEMERLKLQYISLSQKLASLEDELTAGHTPEPLTLN